MCQAPLFKGKPNRHDPCRHRAGICDAETPREHRLGDQLLGLTSQLRRLLGVTSGMLFNLSAPQGPSSVGEG